MEEGRVRRFKHQGPHPTLIAFVAGAHLFEGLEPRLVGLSGAPGPIALDAEFAEVLLDLVALGAGGSALLLAGG